MPVFGHFALRLQGKTGKLAFWLGNCAHFCGFTLVFVLKNTKILQRTKRASRPLFAQNWTKFFAENVVQSGQKWPFFIKKTRRSAARTPICQIVPVSRVYPPPTPLTRGMGITCPAGVFLYSFFCLKVGHFPFKTYGKDQWWIRRSKSPKQPEMPIKQAKTSEHHNWPRYRKWPQIGPTNTIEQGKKRRNEKWYLVRANPRNHPPNGVLCSKTRDFEHLGLKC